MDRAIVERMVGAVVLVLILVLLAPTLLDGSSDDAEPAVAAAPAESGRRTEVIVLNAPRDALPPEPVEEVVAAAGPASATGPAPELVRPMAGNQTPEGFAVQLGSFSVRGNADRFAQRIRTEGHPVFVVRGRSGAGTIYRVYSGPAESREQAGELAAKLKSGGYSVMVVELGDDRG